MKPLMKLSVFIERASEKHDNAYDYSEFQYLGCRVKSSIICKHHGAFEMMPYAHLNGQGCTKCADEFNARKRLKPFSEFLSQANDAHESKYQYTESTYSGDSRKLEILCYEHGAFWQSPNSHLKGRGCPKCSVPGFDVSKEGHLYLLRSDCSAYMKVGIANKLRDRQSRLRHRTPFGFQVVHVYSGCGQSIASLEKHYHSRLESCGFRRFDGATEWFKFDGDIVEEIKGL